jgi:hypothetical protein
VRTEAGHGIRSRLTEKGPDMKVTDSTPEPTPQQFAAAVKTPPATLDEARFEAALRIEEALPLSLVPREPKRFAAKYASVVASRAAARGQTP